MSGGRPTSYEPEFAARAEKACERGATDMELADLFHVDVRTIYRWKLEFPEFCQAIRVGKETADHRVERSLYERANGYEWVEQQAIKVKVGQFEERVEIVEVERKAPPDATSAVFWLKNRKPADWRDKQEHQHTGNLVHSVEVTIVDPKG